MAQTGKEEEAKVRGRSGMMLWKSCSKRVSWMRRRRSGCGGERLQRLMVSRLMLTLVVVVTREKS